MKARVIYNPVSGKEIMKQSLADILDVLELAGYEASAFATTVEKYSAKNEARRAALAGFDLIVAAGGDGTINEVVNGIAGLTTRPKMAIIPAGTTNDYARALKIPRDNVRQAAEVILQGDSIKMDIGQANERYFINIAAGGYLTELTYEVPSELKSIFGYLAYLVKGAEMLPRVKPIDVHLEYEEGIYDGPASMFFLGLTNSVGGLEQIAPDAKLDDGKFSLIIVKTANLFEMLHLVAMVFNGGRHINDPRVIYTKTNFLKVVDKESEKPMMINLDGEYGGDAPMTFTNHHQHIEFFANVHDIADEALMDPIYEESSRAFINEVEELTDEDIDEDGKINGK
ncbi:diacylglycerol kinase [Enterococcus timonensis]|uniref:diacylglycerol kinase n=1 Tax=Enterococcus timonensis TaxID=1852364 RepID=UPI0008D9244F|nr:diacylglycerol kinase [Enterococcus timonensis]